MVVQGLLDNNSTPSKSPTFSAPSTPPQTNQPVPTKRLAIFAFYNADAIIAPYVIYYLNELKKVCDHIIFVADNNLKQDETLKLEGLADTVIHERHGEYDFGSYKRGIQYARINGLLAEVGSLLLCNDSCVGPLHSLKTTFHEMDRRKVDFWGITYNTFSKPHLQTYFCLFNRNVFQSPEFINFFDSVERKENVMQVVIAYEIQMTDLLKKAGYKWSSLISSAPPKHNHLQRKTEGPELRPTFTRQGGSPFVKRKALLRAHCNLDGIATTINMIKNKNYQVYQNLMKEINVEKFLNTKNLSFSLIMPTYNRAYCIQNAIDSILQQAHEKFELIIVDDGSTDNTDQQIKSRYYKEIATGKIRYLHNTSAKGVCGARNTGLNAAKYKWIGYVDSDNTIRENYLQTFAQAIIEYPENKAFYAEFCRLNDGVVVGREYDAHVLSKGNFIDLGVYIHHRDCFKKLGGFDLNLKRLVDWDLIIRYSSKFPPIFIKNILMDYSNDDDPNRISRKESELAARVTLMKKHKFRPIVTVAIPCYNQQAFIHETIESALTQKGDFEMEIILADDGSTDNTQSIIDDYVLKHPGRVRSIGDGINRGISENFRRCFTAAQGDYLAILEGDDIWSSPLKIAKQLKFLAAHQDAVMVFSKILVRNENTGKETTLKRQDNLKNNLLSGQDFLADESMNLIANFSSCMFKTTAMQNLPERLYEARFNEIALAFHLEQEGKIGFINEILSVYRQHPHGVWTGSDKRKQLESGIETRCMVRDVASSCYQEAIQNVIDVKLKELAEL